jgi:tetrahydromethanopterin S-methyltransferase subunit E
MCVLPYFAIVRKGMKPSTLGLTLRAIWLMRLGNIATAEDFHYTANPFRRQYKFRGGYFGLSPTKKSHFLLDGTLPLWYNISI